MVRNIKARPPWQGSRAGLYRHPRDSAGQGESGPGGGGCRSRLPAAGARGTGGGKVGKEGYPRSPSREAESKRRSCRRLGVNEAPGARRRRLPRLGPGSARPAGSALRCISRGQPAGNRISAVAFGENSARPSPPGLRRADKGLRGKARRPCHGGPARLMFNRERGSRASPPGSAPGGWGHRPPPATASQAAPRPLQRNAPLGAAPPGYFLLGSYAKITFVCTLMIYLCG